MNDGVAEVNGWPTPPPQCYQALFLHKKEPGYKAILWSGQVWRSVLLSLPHLPFVRARYGDVFYDPTFL